MALVRDIRKTLDGVNQRARSPGNHRRGAGPAMGLAVDQHAVESNPGGALDVGDGAARSDRMVEFIGVYHPQMVRSEMLLNYGHLGSARRELGLVLLQSEPMMVVGRTAVVHLADHLIKSCFVVQLEPEGHGNLR